MKQENGLPSTAISSERPARVAPASARANTLSAAATAPTNRASTRHASPPRPLPVKKKLAPGARGTKRFLDQFGERLVCVRYRYGETNTRRYTTVELIVGEKELLGGYSDLLQPRRRYPNTMVSVRVGYGEVNLRGQIKQGGRKMGPQVEAVAHPLPQGDGDPPLGPNRRRAG